MANSNLKQLYVYLIHDKYISFTEIKYTYNNILIEWTIGN